MQLVERTVLFAAGLVPGLLMVLLYMAYIITRALINPALAAVGKALSTAINTELAKAKATLKLPTCDSNTDSFKFPSSWPPTADAVKKAASSLICMVDTGATTFEENADGSLTVSGNSRRTFLPAFVSASSPAVLVFAGLWMSESGCMVVALSKVS